MKRTCGLSILIVVDMEGTTGIHNYRQVYSLYDEYWQERWQILTQDVDFRGGFRGDGVALVKHGISTAHLGLPTRYTHASTDIVCEQTSSCVWSLLRVVCSSSEVTQCARASRS
jgi:hypothetical protein